MNATNLIVALIVIAASVNWGLVAGFDWDLFETLSFGSTSIEWYIKVAVGIVGAYYAYLVYTWHMMSKQNQTQMVANY